MSPATVLRPAIPPTLAVRIWDVGPLEVKCLYSVPQAILATIVPEFSVLLIRQALLGRTVTQSTTYPNKLPMLAKGRAQAQRKGKGRMLLKSASMFDLISQAISVAYWRRRPQL